MIKNYQFFAAMDDGTLIQRHKRLSFLNTGTSASPVWTRMQGFSELSESKSTIEYSRHYVDEKTERTDVSGYSTEISFSFDRYSPFSVHEKLADIIDSEALGTDARVEILTVDTFIESGNNARKRTYSVIPDTVGDGTDALVYSGTFKAAGDFTECEATSADGWMTATITP